MLNELKVIKSPTWMKHINTQSHPVHNQDKNVLKSQHDFYNHVVNIARVSDTKTQCFDTIKQISDRLEYTSQK